MRVPTDDDAQAAEERFWRLYAESLPEVYGFLLRRCGREVAEDLTQDVYADLVRRIRGGDDPAGFTTGWLITVARSRLVDHLRAEQRRARKLRLAWSAAAPESRDGLAAEGRQGMSDMSASTERALGLLSTSERCALVLHHLDGLSTIEVAGSIGRSVRATESLLARARRKFRAAVAEAGA